LTFNPTSFNPTMVRLQGSEDDGKNK